MFLGRFYFREEACFTHKKSGSRRLPLLAYAFQHVVARMRLVVATSVGAISIAAISTIIATSAILRA